MSPFIIFNLSHIRIRHICAISFFPQQFSNIISLVSAAPEIVTDEPAYPQTDIWSLGVLTYIMLSGVSPFRGADDAETKQNIAFVRYRFEHLYKEITQVTDSGNIRDIIETYVIYIKFKRF